MDIENIKKKLRAFAEERNWDQFHSPKNLVMALGGEVGELTELFQWLSEGGSMKGNLPKKTIEHAEEELADIFLYLIRLADKLDIDLETAALNKISKNEDKYPVELSKDNAIKYNRRNE